MRIGILGSGRMGGALGTVFARAGHDVVFSYSRSRAKLRKLADQAGGKAGSGTPAEAVADAEVVLVAVHWSCVDDLLAQAGSLSGKTVLTCSLPMSKDDSRLVLGHSSSGAEALAKKVPRARVVSTFSTAPSEVLRTVFKARRRSARPDLVFCGDHKGAKRTASRLIRDAGFHPVDLGTLKAARLIEPFALVLAEVAYSGSIGGRLGYRFERFPKRAV